MRYIIHIHRILFPISYFYDQTAQGNQYYVIYYTFFGKTLIGILALQYLPIVDKWPLKRRFQVVYLLTKIRFLKSGVSLYLTN